MIRILITLLKKEFKQIFRDKALIPLLTIAPIGQLIIFPLAADYEVKNINISIADADRSVMSQRLTNKISESGYFRLIRYTHDYEEAFNDLEGDIADIVLEIPADMEKNLVKEDYHQLFMAVNAINGVKANLGASYLSQMIADFNLDVRTEWYRQPRFNPMPQIRMSVLNWYNPYMNYNYYMVPGILALLVTMVGAYMCALNIVREKEVGTIEQINVAPVSKTLFILGKLIPFWIMGMVTFSVGLFGVSWLFFGIVPVGNLLLLFAYLAIYLVAVLGLGLLISTYSETQQQAISIAFFFMMIFVMMSGLFTPIESMPQWAWFLTQLSPITYFIDVVRMIILKGSGFADIQYHFMIMIAFALVLNTWAVLNYRKTN